MSFRGAFRQHTVLELLIGMAESSPEKMKRIHTWSVLALATLSRFMH